MNIQFDNEKLLHLITNLYTLTGIRANIYDLQGQDLCHSPREMPFCQQLQSCPEGRSRCANCVRQAITNCRTQETACFSRCHAGICEAALPMLFNGRPVAILTIGQFLDNAPRQIQWKHTLKTLDWYPGSLEKLQRSYSIFRQYGEQEISAYLELVKVLQSYISLSGMVYVTEYTDQQRLEIYLAQHYMEKLSLSSISEALHIGRTRLCALAKSISDGHSLTYLITQRRIQAAKDLLLQSDLPISAVGKAVGISDYNYFSKVFRSATGLTPSVFRKSGTLLQSSSDQN